MTCDPDQMGSQQVLSCRSSAVYHSFFPTISPGFSLPVKVLVGPKGEHKESTSQLNFFLPFLFFVVFFLPIGCVADFLVFFELVTDHLQELVGVRTQILHQVHEVLDGLFHNHSALNGKREAKEH